MVCQNEHHKTENVQNVTPQVLQVSEHKAGYWINSEKSKRFRCTSRLVGQQECLPNNVAIQLRFAHHLPILLRNM